MHIPVLVDEVIDVLSPKGGEFVVDLTVGGGGHALRFAERIGKSGILVCIDMDEDMLSIAEKNLLKISEERRPKILLVRSNFRYVDEVIEKVKQYEGVNSLPDVFFADLGISSYHLEWSERGFSFSRTGPLDMRISKDADLTAEDVIMKLSRKEIEDILINYGEERFAKSIAESIVREREKRPIRTTTDLAELVERIYRAKRVRTRIHPATKTFMALRIFVNKEIDNLKALMEKIPSFAKSGTRVGVISFHSLEDRVVKESFKMWQKDGLGEILTKKPIVPSERESILNPRSRSAKFRAFIFR